MEITIDTIRKIITLNEPLKITELNRRLSSLEDLDKYKIIPFKKGSVRNNRTFKEMLGESLKGIGINRNR